MSDSASLPDGLAALASRRTAASRARGPKREIPRSQNPTTLPPYQAPAEAPEPPAVVDLVAEETKAPAPAPAPAAAAATAKPASRKIGLYIDEPHEDFFEAVRAAGLSQRPRVSLSGSAVVRLALDRLMAHMTPEQVRDAIVSKQPVESNTPGRRRW